MQSVRQTILIAGTFALAGSAFGQGPAALPDAQVEANVLKALAGAPELANQPIRTTTVYGTVTLTGSVETEAMRTRAENLAANASGVKKVVDEMTLGAPASAVADTSNPQPAMAADEQASQPMLQSDGTLAPPAGSPQADAQADAQAGAVSPSMNPGDQAPPPPAQAGSSPVPPPYDNRRPMNPQYGYGQQPPPYGGQQPGVTVAVPVGTLLRVRVNQRIASNKTQPGSVFDGIVVNDVVAGGEVAIPRGAAVRGTVIDAKSSGALSGRGELSIQLTQVMLGGKTYPIVSDVWAHNGGDKTVETVNKTAGFGALGALLGAAGGGGVGAAVGGGIGAAVGLGSSASSGKGQVIIPSEGIVTFHLAQQAAVVTVSEQEMQRLAYGVPYGAQPNYPPPPRRYYRPYYYPY
jgi:hypothetical protein